MDGHIATVLLVVAALITAFDSRAASSPQSGEAGRSSSQPDQNGRTSANEKVQAGDDVRRGMGSAAGAVTGALIGSQLGDGSRRNIITGAAIGAAVGSHGQTRLPRKDEQRVTAGTAARSVQPIDDEWSGGTHARTDDGGEAARAE